MRQLGTLAAAVAGALLAVVGGCSWTRGNVVHASAQGGDTRTFSSLMSVAGLNDRYSKGGPYTFFIPSDQAFEQLPRGVVVELQRPGNHERLVAFLTYHIVRGNFATRDFTSTRELRTDNGATIRIGNNEDNQWLYGDGVIITPNVGTWNGEYHVINKVQIPPGLQIPSKF